MVANTLKALLNIQKYKSNKLNKIVAVSNPNSPRVNVVGDKLEAYVKDALTNSFHIKNPKDKMEEYLKELSHLGSQNNPPDIMIRGGDAFEVKKVNNLGGGSIPLNSSYPKQKLSSKDPMITTECKNCEKWEEKDFVYCVGNVIDNDIKILSFIYGDCYSAKKEHYEKIRKSMIDGIGELKVEFSKTRELARLNKIDPLKITDLRIRGMWQIKSPLWVFPDLIKVPEKDCIVYALMKKEKFNSFSEEDKKEVRKNMNMINVKINNPDNPKEKMDAVLISFDF